MEPYGYPAALLAQACGVDISTARKWKRAGRIPSQYHQWLKFYFGHDLGAFAKHWEGWRLHDGLLYSPEGEPYTPAAVRAAPYYRQSAEAWRKELQRVIETVDSDQERRERLQQMEILQTALYEAQQAFQLLKARLSAREQTKLHHAHPVTCAARARSDAHAETLQALIAERV